MRSTPAPSRLTRLGAVARTGLCWAAIIALLASPSAAHAARAEGRIAYVFDADTFRLDSGTRIRIANIDAAETRPDRAKCAREIAIGKNATRRARIMLEGQRINYQIVGRNRDRFVAKVWFHSRDLGDRLIAEGLARPWLRRHPKPNWCDSRR